MTVGLVIVATTSAAAGTGRWLLASSADAHATKPLDPLPISVRTLPVADRLVGSGLRYTGVARELRKSDLSFKVAGTVQDLLQVEGPGGRMRDLHEGDTLEQGAVMARLDPDDYRRDQAQAAEKLTMAIARLAQSKAATERAQVDHRRNEQLVHRNSISASDHDSSRIKLKEMTATEAAAEGEVAAARIALEQAEANLGYCELRAPFARSTVAAREVDLNGRVMVGQKTFTIVDISRIVIGAYVPDTLVGRLEIGQQVEIASDALPDDRFVGVIHQVASSADERTRTYPIEVRVDDPRGLRPGMVATIVIRKETRAYLLPMTAIAPGPSPRSVVVYRVAEEGGRSVVHAVPVEFDDVLDNQVSVRMPTGTSHGLRPGDRVVATGLHRMRDGQEVHVVE